jgi:hypothetical protein
MIFCPIFLYKIQWLPNFFQKTFIPSNPTCITSFSHCLPLYKKYCSEHEVGLQKMKNMELQLKDSASVYVFPLSVIFNLSLRSIVHSSA